MEGKSGTKEELNNKLIFLEGGASCCTKLKVTGAKIGRDAKILNCSKFPHQCEISHQFQIPHKCENFALVRNFAPALNFSTVRNFALVRKLRTCAKISHLCSKFFAAGFQRLQSILLSYLKGCFESESSCSERLQTKIRNKMPILPSC